MGPFSVDRFPNPVPLQLCGESPSWRKPSELCRPIGNRSCPGALAYYLQTLHPARYPAHKQGASGSRAVGVCLSVSSGVGVRAVGGGYIWLVVLAYGIAGDNIVCIE